MAQQGLFRKRAVAEQQPDNEILEMIRRSRVLEGRYANLERRAQVVEENMIEHNRKLLSGVRTLNQELVDARKAIADLAEKVEYIATELQDFARKEEIQVMKKYLDYWDPMNFVTMKQVEKIVNEIIDSKGIKRH